MSRSTPALLAALISCCLGVQPATAFDPFHPDRWFAPDTCQMQIPNVTISTLPSEVRIDHTLTHDEIDATARTLRGAVMAGWRTNGLAEARLRTDGATTVNVVQLSDGRWCGYLESADFAISYEDPLKIYISRFYDESSCPYRAILKHELQHVDIYRSTLRSHLGGAAERVIEMLVVAGPVVADSKEEVSDVLESRVGKAIMEVANGIATEAKQLNAALDTPGSYMQVQSGCPSW